MFRALLIVCLILTSVQAHAQLSGQARIDSLLAELPYAKGDTNEVNLLVNLSNTYAPIDTEKGIEYGENAMKVSNSISWNQGIAKSYNCIGYNYFYIREKRKKGIEYYSKVMGMEDKLDDKTIIAVTLYDIGEIYRYTPDYKKALEYYKKSNTKYKSLNNMKGIADSYGMIGYMYEYLSDFPNALENYQKEFEIEQEINNESGMAKSLYSIGEVYNHLSENSKAVEYYEKAMELYEKLDDKRGKSNVLHSLGTKNIEDENYDKALGYLDESIKLKSEIGDRYNKAGVVFSKGSLYHAKKDYLKAMDYYQEALEVFIEWNYLVALALACARIADLYVDITKDKVSINYSELNEHVSLNKEVNLNNAIDYSLSSINLFNKTGDLSNKSQVYKVLADAYKLKGDMTKAYEALEEHHKLKDSVFNQENSDKIATLEKAREDDLKQKEIEKQKEIDQIIMYVTIAGFIILIVVLIIIYRLLKRSDKLLYNVLPVSIAKRLKNKEHPISDYFTQASIVFIDIVNFTEMAKDEDPRKLVEALNSIFTSYDTIANKYGLEKIKTIGDSYMAAAGIPEVQKDNTHRAAQMALEVKQLMSDYKTADGTRIEVRIGLDCGPVVAGVIGENKFIYDMWSDAVNTASRMESTSESGQVHITDRFKEAVSEYEEFEYVERGEIEIKGKGMMKTYYIENKEVESV